MWLEAAESARGLAFTPGDRTERGGSGGKTATKIK